MANKLKTFLGKHLLAMSNTVKVDGILLTILQDKGVITDGFMTEIEAIPGNFVKNAKLWAFVRDARTDADIPTIVDALEASSNSGALDLLKENSLITVDENKSIGSSESLGNDGTTLKMNKATLLKDTITRNFQGLCYAINCNDSFLTLLYTNYIITQSLMSEVKLLQDNTTKAAKILDFLKDCRTDDDFSKFVGILKTSGNSKAVDILTEPITLPSFTPYDVYQGVVAGFIERRELQQHAFKHLTSKPNRGTQITFPVVVLHGFGGNGKSQMARRLVQLLTQEFNDSENITNCISSWINATSEASAIDGFRNFANAGTGANISTVIKSIHKQMELTDFLLVLDNGDDFEMLKKFLPLNDPRTKARVIVTSHSEWLCGDQNVENIAVSNFTVAEFKDFVGKSVNCTISEEDSKQLEGYTSRIPAILSLVCKGFVQRLKGDSKYTISQHLKKYGDKLLTFGEDEKLFPGLAASDYKKSAKIVVQQQLECMNNWDFESPELIDLAKFILNCISYCDPVKISEKNFFMNHPQILRKSNEDYAVVREAIGILRTFGWIELVYDDGKLEAYSIHTCYQIGIKSQLDEQISESILHGMIEYVQSLKIEEITDNCREKYSHLAAFWPHISNHSKRSSLLTHAIKTHHCLLGLAGISLTDEVKALIGAYCDQGDFLHSLLRDEIDGDKPYSPMEYIFRNVTNHELVKYFLFEIEEYCDNLEDSQKKVWIQQQLLWATICAMDPIKSENYKTGITKPEFEFADQEVVAVSVRKFYFETCKYFRVVQKLFLTAHFGGNINWRKKDCRGRPFRRLCTSMAVSEEILSRIPCTVILSFSPRPTKLAQSDTTFSPKTELMCMKEMETFFKSYFPKVAIQSITFVNQIVVGSLDWTLLRKLIHHSFDFNIVVDNQHNIVSASIGKSLKTPAADNLKRQYTNEHFKAFESLWPPKTRNEKPIKVGIFDSGADLTRLTHPTKMKPIMLRCYIPNRQPKEPVVKEEACSDIPSQHGTKVAYVLDKTSCPGTEIYCFSIYDENDDPDDAAILLALDCAISTGISIVNCSFNLKAAELSSGRDLAPLLNAFAKANKEHGIVPVFSAGNHTPPTTFVLPPAQCGISVGSHRVGDDCRWSNFSCGQCSADIATAGEGLLLFDNNPVIESGTSFAAPAISGFLTYLLHLSDIYKRPDLIKKLFDDTAAKILCQQWRCTRWSEVGCPKKLEVALAYQEAQNQILRNEFPPVCPQVVPNNAFNDDMFMDVDD